jgi:hypothetical protein
MQDKAGAQVDELVKRMRHYEFVPFDLHDEAADALESQSAELTRLRERNAELEKELGLANRQIAATGRAWSADRTRLEATVREMREALEWYGENARLCRLIHGEGDKGRNALSDDGGKRACAVIASLESVVGKSKGQKDGVEQ